MIGFFRRHAALLIAVALASGFAPSISLAQQVATKSAPPGCPYCARRIAGPE